MVIAKQEWFKSKKGDFWRLDIPWQGYVYGLIIISIPLIVPLILPNGLISSVIIIGLILFLLIDLIPAFYKSLDERDRTIYTISGNNSFWGMIAAFFLSIPISIYNPNLNDLSPLIMILGGVLTFFGTLAIQYKKGLPEEKF